jgi:hypothetical protein
MKPLYKRILAAGVVIAVVAQFVRPDRTNPETDPSLSIRNDSLLTPAVLSLLERACFDCHTNETIWPWYSNITPVNFLVVRDVSEGRKHINLAEWSSQPVARRASMLERMYDEVSDGNMPLPPYLLFHPEASFSEEEKTQLLDWLASTQDSLMAGME